MADSNTGGNGEIEFDVLTMGGGAEFQKARAATVAEIEKATAQVGKIGRDLLNIIATTGCEVAGRELTEAEKQAIEAAGEYPKIGFMQGMSAAISLLSMTVLAEMVAEPIDSVEPGENDE